MNDIIRGFVGEYRFLSNFWPADIRVRGVTYPTMEHAFQACKTLDPLERQRILACRTPGEAKRAGRTVTLRADWEGVKLDVMHGLVTAKFRHPVLRARLLATGTAELVEENTWGDVYWGVCRGRGENHLGRILMQVCANLTP